MTTFGTIMGSFARTCLFGLVETVLVGAGQIAHCSTVSCCHEGGTRANVFCHDENSLSGVLGFTQSLELLPGDSARYHSALDFKDNELGARLDLSKALSFFLGQMFAAVLYGVAGNGDSARFGGARSATTARLGRNNTAGTDDE